MRKIRNFFARVIVKLVNGSEYSFTTLSGENITSVEHLQEFGFASEKPDGEDARGIALFYAGDRGNSSLLVLEVPKFKPDLSAGESALFNAHDALIKLDSSGVINLNGSSNGGLIEIANLTTKLNLLITEFDAHMHTYENRFAVPTLSTPPTNPVSVPLLATEFDKDDYENTKVVH